MTGRPERPQQEAVERIVSRVMSSGMAISFVCYAIGLVLLLLRKQAELHTAQQYYHSLPEFFQAVASGESSAFLYLGTASLILTPFVLVLFSIPAFMRQHDRRFAFIAALVLLVMIASAIVGSVFKLKI